MENIKNTFVFEGNLIKVTEEWKEHGAISVPKFTYIITEKGENGEPPVKKMRIA